MIIQHNIPAINAHRQLGINNSALSKNLEKLSSGYRINRAADDAAGLAISEKMRAQITGLNRAVLNAQDGASLIQSAEGALQEVHGMLNRMVELATQSANGTIQADDRQKIEAEVEALKEEIDRISKATNFNGIQLLDGSLGGKNVKNIDIKGLTGATATTSVATKATSDVTIGDPSALVGGNKASYSITLADGSSYSFDFTVSADGSKILSKDGTEYGITAGAATEAEVGAALLSEINKVGALTSKFDVVFDGTDTLTFTAKEGGSTGATIAAMGENIAGTINGITPVVVPGLDETKGFAFTQFTGGNIDAATFSVNGVKFVVADSAANAALVTDKSVNVIVAGTTTADYASVAQQISAKTGLKVDNIAQDGTTATVNLVFHSEGPKGLTMQVGDTADDFNKITVKVDDMSSTGIGIRDISMATQESAAAALTKIKAAIGKVSENRGNLGALQNRLEHTINNLNVTSENMTAAESRIRDVDMAKEMMQFTKNNVLSQAAQAMLAQANQQPQQVLQLLR